MNPWEWKGVKFNWNDYICSITPELGTVNFLLRPCLKESEAVCVCEDPGKGE